MAGVFPETTKRWALVALPLNLVPGVGTMVASGNREDLRPFYLGLMQFLLFLIAVLLGGLSSMAAGLIGITALAWSLTWALLTYAKAS